MKAETTLQRHQLSGTELPIEGVPPLIERLLQHRGIASAAEVEFGLNKLLPPDGLLGIEIP